MDSIWESLDVPARSGADRAKRIFDVAAAAVLLFLFAPVLAIAAIAIRLDGSPSVLFTQTRIGRNGKPFEIFKLTTMKPSAHLNGPLVSTSNDPRVTRTGRIIRAFCINELPQLLNVMRGDMSLVGPRPEVPRYIKSWPADVVERLLAVRPGITGLATIRIWNESALLEDKADVERAYVEEVLPLKHQIELWYVDHRSLWLDLWILAVTFLKTLSGRRLLGPAGKSAPRRSYREEVS